MGSGAAGVARARRRVGTVNFEPVLEAIIAVAAGQSDNLANDEVDLLERATGLDRGRSPTPGSPAGWLGGDIRQALTSAGRLFDPAHLVTIATNTNSTAAASAASELRIFSTVVVSFTRMVERFDRWAFGFGMLATALDEMLSDPEGQAILVLFWLAFYDGGLGRNIEQIVRLAPQAEGMSGFRTLIAAIRRDVRGAAEAIPERLVAAATVFPERQKELAARILELRKTEANAIDAVLARFPEVLMSEPTATREIDAASTTIGGDEESG